MPETTGLAAKLDELRTLQPGWDGHGAPPIDERAIVTAHRFGAHFDRDYMGITPTSLGGIQLEWHRDGYDIELEIASSGHLITLLIESFDDACATRDIPQYDAAASLITAVLAAAVHMLSREVTP